MSRSSDLTDFQKAPPEALKDMVCIIQIKGKTAFSSTSLRAYSRARTTKTTSKFRTVSDGDVSVPSILSGKEFNLVSVLFDNNTN